MNSSYHSQTATCEINSYFFDSDFLLRLTNTENFIKVASFVTDSVVSSLKKYNQISIQKQNLSEIPYLSQGFCLVIYSLLETFLTDLLNPDAENIPKTISDIHLTLKQKIQSLKEATKINDSINVEESLKDAITTLIDLFDSNCNKGNICSSFTYFIYNYILYNYNSQSENRQSFSTEFKLFAIKYKNQSIQNLFHPQNIDDERKIDSKITKQSEETINYININNNEHPKAPSFS